MESRKVAANVVRVDNDSTVYRRYINMTDIPIRKCSVLQESYTKARKFIGLDNINIYVYLSISCGQILREIWQ